MSDHDLAAELQAYKNELDFAEQRGMDDRAAAVREEISRVEGEVRDRVQELEAAAEEHLAKGQDVLAAQRTVEARRYKDLLGEQEAPKRAARSARAGKENAADKTPKETA